MAEPNIEPNKGEAMSDEDDALARLLEALAPVLAVLREFGDLTAEERVALAIETLVSTDRMDRHDFKENTHLTPAQQTVIDLFLRHLPADAKQQARYHAWLTRRYGLTLRQGMEAVEEAYRRYVEARPKN